VTANGRLRTIIAAGALCIGAANLPCLAAGAANRVVSLNLCTDQMLVLLAPEKVAGLTPLARDPALSFVASQAAHLPIVRASAEAVLALRPDLILAAPYGAQNTLALLEQEGTPVLRIDLAQDFAGIRRQTRVLAAALGVPQRAEALLAAMDATLAALPHPDREFRALVWEPRGLTAGHGTLMDAVLRSAGLVNASDGRRVGLEALLRNPPDLLIVPETPEFPSLATALLDHPALTGLRRRAIPPALTICAGPFTAEAAALLTR
jgi:iron complex transport system substrate-binding protein